MSNSYEPDTGHIEVPLIWGQEEMEVSDTSEDFELDIIDLDDE